MATPLDPTSMAFLFAENRSMPMHVGGLHLYRPPADAGPDYARTLYEQMRDVEEVAPLFHKRPYHSLTMAGAWAWKPDAMFDIDYHVRHGALPRPGRIRELLDLCSRLHGTRLALERPLWESYVIEGLQDGRVALYTKMHHALVDGVSAMRLMHSVLTPDPELRGMPAPWSADAAGARRMSGTDDGHRPLGELPAAALRSALGISAEAAGLPAALIRTLNRGVRNETSAVSLHAPRTILNQSITGSRRFAAQDWPMERLRAVGRAGGTTVNDVVLAMCSGAVRAYLAELGALPDSSLVSMVPVGLEAKQASIASAEGGNAVGAVMVKLGTDLPDAGDRLATIHESMVTGKEALSSMTPTQILAMSALGMAPSILVPMLRMQGVVRPPFNLIISNVPGPRESLYFNGAELVGMYPLSIPIHGMALNITCTSYAGTISFGLTGCRRTLPSVQRLLTHLEDELAALEKATGA